MDDVIKHIFNSDVRIYGDNVCTALVVTHHFGQANDFQRIFMSQKCVQIQTKLSQGCLYVCSNKTRTHALGLIKWGLQSQSPKEGFYYRFSLNCCVCWTFLVLPCLIWSGLMVSAKTTSQFVELIYTHTSFKELDMLDCDLALVVWIAQINVI